MTITATKKRSFRPIGTLFPQPPTASAKVNIGLTQDVNICPTLLRTVEETEEPESGERKQHAECKRQEVFRQSRQLGEWHRLLEIQDRKVARMKEYISEREEKSRDRERENREQREALQKREETIRQREEAIQKGEETAHNKEEANSKQEEDLRKRERNIRAQEEAICSREEMCRQEDASLCKRQETLRQEVEAVGKQREINEQQEQDVHKREQAIQQREEFVRRREAELEIEQQKATEREQETEKTRQKWLQKAEAARKSEEEFERQRQQTIRSAQEADETRARMEADIDRVRRAADLERQLQDAREQKKQERYELTENLREAAVIETDLRRQLREALKGLGAIDVSVLQVDSGGDFSWVGDATYLTPAIRNQIMSVKETFLKDLRSQYYIWKIEYVMNYHLYEKFSKAKEALRGLGKSTQEVLLFHGTKAENVDRYYWPVIIN